MMHDVLSDFNGLKIVVSSLAGVVAFLKDRFDSVYLMLRERGMVKELPDLPSKILSKIWVDTSSVSSRQILDIAVDFFGPDKILFASDYPAGSLSKQEDLFKNVANREKYIAGNFKNLFGL